MEIDDIDYIDELLYGLEGKLGATLPLCLQQPILGSSSSTPAHGGGSSTPLRHDERRPKSPDSTPVTALRADHDNVRSVIREKFEDVLAIKHDQSSTKHLSIKRQRLEDNYRKLKGDMTALREMDVNLLKQLLAVYDAVEELRWMMESFDMSDSCESITSSVHESIEQIHEKWMTERRQWQSTSSRDLSSWRDDSRFNIHQVGRLNSTGSRMRAVNWRSPQSDMNSSFPQITAGKSNFEKQRRSSVDHLPIVPSVESPQPSPITTRKRRSSSGALEAGVVETKDAEEEKEKPAESPGNYVKKPRFLFHSKSSPSFEAQLKWVEVTDTTAV